MSLLRAPTYRWTVEEYEDLGRAGIFDENDRVELLNGEIVVMSPIGYRPATAVNLLNEFFVSHARQRYVVTSGNPFILDTHSEPQPDLCLIDRAVNTQGHHAGPEQVFLVVEVADSTIRYDREDKGPAYARNEIREYWILNLDENVLEVFRNPAGGRFQESLSFGPNEEITPLAFPDLRLRLGDFLP